MLYCVSFIFPMNKKASVFCIVVPVLAFVSCAFFRIGVPMTPEAVFLGRGDVRDSQAYRRVSDYLQKGAALERAKIDFLLELIRRSRYIFLRNGAIYSGGRAAAHLTWKYHRKAVKIVTAQEFIEDVATRSKSTGRLYLVKMGEKESYPLRDVLLNELRRLDRFLEEDKKSLVEKGRQTA